MGNTTSRTILTSVLRFLVDWRNIATSLKMSRQAVLSVNADYISDGVSCRFVKPKGIELEFVKARTAVFIGVATQRQKVAQLRRIEGKFCRRLAHKPL